MSLVINRTLTLDDDDARDINAAIAFWQRFRVRLPEGDSCTAGAVLGEICRNWLESHGALHQDGNQPKGDGHEAE